VFVVTITMSAAAEVARIAFSGAIVLDGPGARRLSNTDLGVLDSNITGF
jgi:hypothetical protein